MTEHPTRGRQAGLATALTLAVGALALLGSPPGLAQQEAQQAETQTRKTPAMREKVYAKLSEAQEAAEGGDHATALKALQDVRNMDDLNSYELAQLYNFYGYIYYTQEKYREAVEAYETVLRQPELPIAMENNTLYTLAQLYFTQDNYTKAVDHLNRWFRVAENPGPEPYVLLGQALYQLERYRDAIPPVERAMAVAREQNKPIQENWWLLLRVFHYELQNYPKVIEILEQLLRNWPKREYLIQLAAMYGETGQEQRQLTAYETAYLHGWLTRSQELVLLAQLYLQADVPYSAAKVLDKGFADGVIEKTANNYRLLSQSWTLAQNDDKAIPPLMQAARLTDDGELDVRLAQSYMNLGQWQRAVEAAREALRKGIDRQDEVQVMLGMSLYNLQRYDQAKSAFRVAQSDSRSSRTASQWIRYIDKEQERLQQLEESLR